MGILDSSGTLVTTYKYDGWGNCTVEDTSTNQIGYKNPLRYRSYYYDSETGYYYLNSRYYDSEVGRFISADDTTNLGANNDYSSLNLFAYCGNNPIHRIDEVGDFWGPAIFGAIVGFGSQVINNALEGELWYKNVVGATVGGAVSSIIGGVGGIMISNVISVSLNYMQSKVCDYDYSDKDVAFDLILGATLDISIGRITGSLVDCNNKWIMKSSSKVKSKIASKFVANTDSPVLRESAGNGVDYFSSVLDSRIRLKADRVVYHLKTGTNKNPYSSKSVFSQSIFGFLR